MKRSSFFPGFLNSVFIFAFALFLISAESQDMPFGGDQDVQFATAMWKAMQGYEEWPMKSGFYPGQSPHGKVLRLYYNIVNVDGKPYHVIVKDNYGGQGATVQSVSESPDNYLAAITIMVQRKEGYDPDNNNWFYAKYNKDGSLDQNEKGLKMAGRVAKGMSSGCIACHTKAGGGDFIFSND